MRSLRLAYIVALTFLLSITVSLGQTAFYPKPSNPSTTSSLSLLSLEGRGNTSQNKTKYQDDLKSYNEAVKSHGRNQFIISLIIGVIFVAAGLSIASISTAISTAIVLTGGITFSFGQVLMLVANMGSLFSSYYGSSGGSDFSIDLIIEFSVALVGSIVLIIVGVFKKFQDDVITPFVPPQPVTTDSLPPLGHA